VAPCAALAVLVNEGTLKAGLLHYGFEVAWAFSIYLEAIAILPQLIMTQRHKSVENITSWYMASLGAYRGLYVLNWIFRFFAEPNYRAYIPWIAGVIQTIFYADFFYYFYQCKMK
jgi:ER lumen protein retaining receptor